MEALERKSEADLTYPLLRLLEVAGEGAWLHEGRQRGAGGRKALGRQRERGVPGVEDVEDFRDRFHAGAIPQREGAADAQVQLGEWRAAAAVHRFARAHLFERRRTVVVQSGEAVRGGCHVV